MATWDELKNKIGKGVYRIEMAEGFVPANEADERWEHFMAAQFTGRGSGPMLEIDRYIGSAANRNEGNGIDRL